MIRAEILDAAKQAITVDRAATHGNAENSFALIGNLWAAYLGCTVSPADVAAMMVLFKMARAKGNPGHVDNWADAVGYSALGGEIAAPVPELATNITGKPFCPAQPVADWFEAKKAVAECVINPYRWPDAVTKKG